MSISPSRFEKKEMALSGGSYVYLPVELPVYAVEVNHSEPINGVLLQRALDRTLKRMPYMGDTLVEEDGRVWYATNPLPMKAAHTAQLRQVGGAETNYHMLDLTWDGSTTWFCMYHGFCDGQGINAFMETVLYHYYCMKDGVEYDPMGIRTDREEMSSAEEFDPFSRPYELSPDFVRSEKTEQPTPYHLPELSFTQSRELWSYSLQIPSQELMSFVRANGATPAVALSMFVGEAVQKVHPEADAPIFANIPLSMRRMLGCEETFKNCSSRALLPVTGTPMDALPFAGRAAALRGLLKKQMDADQMRMVVNFSGNTYRQRFENARDFNEEVARPSTWASVCFDTFFVDYIGVLRPTAYSSQITDVHFLCKPAAGSTLHLNMIEHGGRFQVECLACYDVEDYVNALVETLKEHGIPVACAPVRRFTLPAVAWPRDRISL